MNKIISEFSKWQLRAGDGKLETIITNNESVDQHFIVPEKFVVRSSSNLIQTLIDIIYPDFLNNKADHNYLKSRAILMPINVMVDDINSRVLDKLPGNLHTYVSQDSIDDNGGEDIDYDDSFPIMGLCNGTQMIVTACKKNNIEREILCGSQVGTKHLIPRIDMVPTDTKWPFEFKRTQFPLQLCFAMTVNKSQCQSLDTIGLYLPRPVFCHGQLYVIISRVTSPDDLHIFIDDDSGSTTNITSNVVFKEVFYNLPSID